MDVARISAEAVSHPKDGSANVSEEEWLNLEEAEKALSSVSGVEYLITFCGNHRSLSAPDSG